MKILNTSSTDITRKIGGTSVHWAPNAEVTIADNLMQEAFAVVSATAELAVTNLSSSELNTDGSDQMSGTFTFSPTGEIVLPVRTSTQILALTAVAGMVVFNSTTAKAQVFDGTIWNDLF